MFFDKKSFSKKCNEMLDDVQEGQPKSKAWISLGIGAISGLLISCLRLKRRSGKPIIAKYTRVDQPEEIKKSRRF